MIKTDGVAAVLKFQPLADYRLSAVSRRRGLSTNNSPLSLVMRRGGLRCISRSCRSCFGNETGPKPKANAETLMNYGLLILIKQDTRGVSQYANA